jgi:hypothetical protein
MRVVITVKRSVEPEPAGYKIQSGNHSLVETPAHTHRRHRIPAFRHAALTLKHGSLRSNRRSIRHGCRQTKSEKSSACSLEVKPTGKKSKENKEKSGQSSAAHLVERLCVKVVR